MPHEVGRVGQHARPRGSWCSPRARWATGRSCCQAWSEPSGWNWTCIELPEEGGALYRATSGLDVGLIDRVGPDHPRIRGIGRTCGLAGRGVEVVLDDHLDLIAPLLHGVPGEAVAGAEVANHVGRDRRSVRRGTGRRVLAPWSLAVAVQTTGDPTRGTDGPLPDRETDRRQRSSRDLQCGQNDRERRIETCLVLRSREVFWSRHIV